MIARALPRPGDLSRAHALRIGQECAQTWPLVRLRYEFTCPRCGVRVADRTVNSISPRYTCSVCGWWGDPEWFGLRIISTGPGRSDA